MKLRSTVAVLAAAGAITTVGATAAMAFEHQFSGAFTVYTDNSNINGSRAGQDGYNQVTNTAGVPFDKKAPNANYIESRARLGYTAKANDDLKFVSMFELDYNYWGNSSYTNGRGGGGAIGADSVNIETKSLYLDANVSKNTNIKLGMQGFDDAFKGVFVGADMAGILVTHGYSKATASVGAFRWNDNSPLDSRYNYYPATALGRQTRDFLVLDGKYELNKHTKIGAAYYFMKDNAENRDTIHMVGVNAEATAGPVTLDGFVAGQFGEVGPAQKDLYAYSASLGAKMKAGKGTVRADLLYASGDEGTDSSKTHAFQSVDNRTAGSHESGYYANEMVILGRDKNAFTIDNAIVHQANNQNHGVIFLAAGYDMPLAAKLNGSANIGSAWNDSRVGTEKNSNRHLGTEVNAELVYNVVDNVTLSARGAYVFLGDFYKGIATNGTPDDLYDFKLIAKYVF